MINMLTTNKLGKGNKSLKGTDWTDMDVEKSNEMVDKIDKTLNVTPPDGAWMEYVSGGVTLLSISSTKH
ncbi:hypothetical protein Tco_0342559, partial [Tanacetum coccineum]